MTLETQVSGDPGACHRSSRQLGDLAEATSRASASLARRSRLSVADFGGLSGDAFRGHAAALAERLSTASDRCHLLGRAMEQLALDLDRVTALMEQARATARARRLVVEGDTIVVPGPYADVDQHRAWRELRAVVAGIRELEDRAQRDWTRALEARSSGARTPRTAAPGHNGIPSPKDSGATAPQSDTSGSTPAGVTAPAGTATPGGAPTALVPSAAYAPSTQSQSTPSQSPQSQSAQSLLAEPAAPTMWAAEQLGVHALPWLPAPAGGVAFEEVLDEAR